MLQALRFNDIDELRAGLEELQRNAMYEEVSKDVDPDLVVPANDIGKLLEQIDKIIGDPESQRDPDQMMLIANRLKQEDQPVESIFRENFEQIQQEATA